MYDHSIEVREKFENKIKKLEDLKLNVLNEKKKIMESKNVSER
jgi:hypothetical protein